MRAVGEELDELDGLPEGAPDSPRRDEGVGVGGEPEPAEEVLPAGLEAPQRVS
jgi:hypothetical protein